MVVGGDDDCSDMGAFLWGCRDVEINVSAAPRRAPEVKTQ